MLGEPQRDEALLHLQRGLQLERANRVEEAVEEYRQALLHNPHLAEAHDALGSYYQRHGLLAKAAEEFRIVANLEGSFLAHFNVGCLLIELGRYEEAVADFRACLLHDPDDAAVHYEIALAEYRRGDFHSALFHLQIARRRYPDDAEIYRLLGGAYLRLGSYDDAQANYELALRMARRARDRLRAEERLRALARYRELGTLRSAKDRLYAEEGVACLGSTQDDGLQIDEFGDFHFTYPDIAVTLRRLVALAGACHWQLSCVVAVDRVSRPLADALAGALGLPRRHADELRGGETALLTLAVGHEAELIALAVERTPVPTVTFCLGLNWMRHSDALPDVVGLIARGACSVPWEPELRRLRADGASAELIERCLDDAAAQITAALRDGEAEARAAAQAEYYCRHTGLRFAATVMPGATHPPKPRPSPEVFGGLSDVR